MQRKVDKVHFKRYRRKQVVLIKFEYQNTGGKLMNFGEKLIKLRKEKGLSQEALAEKFL